MSIDGNYIIVGTFDVNYAYIFYYNGTNWGEQSILRGSDTVTNPNSDIFGASVAINGDYCVVGAPGADIGPVTNQGAAYIFHRIGTVWTEEQKINADYTNGRYDNQFGTSVAIYNTTVVAGAPYCASNYTEDKGRAYVFERTGNSWVQDVVLQASDGIYNLRFGISVSIDNNHIIVGRDLGYVTSKQGSAYIFDK